jgi:hypothetical protein
MYVYEIYNNNLVTPLDDQFLSETSPWKDIIEYNNQENITSKISGNPDVDKFRINIRVFSES